MITPQPTSASAMNTTGMPAPPGTLAAPAYRQRPPLPAHRTAITPEYRTAITPEHRTPIVHQRPVTVRKRQSVKPHRRQSVITRGKELINYQPTLPMNHRPMLALLIAAHNEELVLENTIRSAMRAGMHKRHIYVVDDNSSDTTSQIARSILGPEHVIKVGRSGKGLALTKANKHFHLTRRYRWIHIADADGAFSPDYFKVFRKRLRVKYAAATGYVRSLPGGPISQYRVMEYTVGQEIHRRFQALTHTVTVIPGPTSCFRADVFRQVDFANKSLTEDFDVTLQIHRKKLGHIQFIPEAVAYTQDPKNLADFTKQITRWNRGVLQGIRRHGIGRKFNRLDAYLSYQVLQNLSFFASYFVLLPYLALTRNAAQVVALAFLYDVAITASITMLVALHARRFDILSAFPHIYAYRYVSLYVFLKAFAEVILLRRFKVSNGVWSTDGRRYKPTGAA